MKQKNKQEKPKYVEKRVWPMYRVHWGLGLATRWLLEMLDPKTTQSLHSPHGAGWNEE